MFDWRTDDRTKKLRAIYEVGRSVAILDLLSAARSSSDPAVRAAGARIDEMDTILSYLRCEDEKERDDD